MYKISVPININTLTEENRDELVRTLKKCEVQRVFLCGGLSFSLAERFEKLKKVKEYAAFFKKNGFETGLWTSTVGHGTVLSHETAEQSKPEYTLIKTASGGELADTYCPLDENFRKTISEWIATVSDTGVDLIMLDDDFRMSQRGDGIGSITCCCDRHLKLMSKLSSEPITAETVRNTILQGKPSIYRDAWLKAQGEGMRLLAKDIRGALDKKNKELPIALCSAWCNWNVDGADALELSKLLAGDNRPVLRLHGAPYWKSLRMYGSTVISVSELERMLTSFCEGEDVELFTEGDVYPRPRYNVPAAHLEAFDLIQRAHGEVNSALKYMLDYVASPDYETGYINAHLRNLEAAKKLTEHFTGEHEGVRIYVYPHLFGKSYVHKTESARLSITPEAYGAVFAENGIPTVYKGKGICSCVFGNNAVKAPESAYENGAMLDLDSARYLTQKGVDVGIERLGEDKVVSFGREYFGATVAPVTAKTRIFGATLKKNAIPVSHVEIDGERIVTSYCYVDGRGRKFFVLCFPAVENGAIRINYACQQSLKEAVEWISDKTLPVFCGKNPYLYTVVKRDGKKLRAAFFNCYDDNVLDPVIELEREYETVRFIHGSGKLNGNKLLLECALTPYGFTAFELE